MNTMDKAGPNISRVLLYLLALMGAVASAAAPLPVKLAAGANDLQRAVWACEAGGESLRTPPKAGEVRSRFFLGTVDNSAHKRDESPLILQGTHLSGLGNLSNDRGWSNMRFDCTLSRDLREGKTFKFEIVSPIPANNALPPTSGPTKAPAARKATWYVKGANPEYLFHGIKETDDRDFVASCANGSGKVEVILTNTVKWRKKDNYVTVSITSRDGAGLYIGRGILDDNLGVTVPIFTVDIKDPLLSLIATGSSLHINIRSEAVYDVSLKSAAQAVKNFSSACR
jgi:hypothetical protein